MVSLGEVANDEFFDVSHLGESGSLKGGRMTRLVCTNSFCLGKGAFMKQEVCPFHKGNVSGAKAGVREVGIAARGCSRCGELFVGETASVVGGPSSALSDIGEPVVRNLEKVYHVPSYVGESGFLAKEESTTGNAVVERQCCDLQSRILVDGLASGTGEGMKPNLETDVPAEQFEGGAQCLLKAFKGVYVKVCSASKEVERGNNAWQSVTVIAMKMRDEYVLESSESDSGPTQLELGAFTAVNHVNLPP